MNCLLIRYFGFFLFITGLFLSCKQSVSIKSNEELLVASPWFVNELQIDQEGQKSYYKRGGVGNTANYDAHFNTFAADGSGYVYGGNAPAPLKWRFIDSEKKVLSITVYFPSQAVDLLWNITDFSDAALKYKETFTQNGYKYNNVGVRTPTM